MKSAIAEAYELERKLAVLRAQKGLLGYVLATNAAYEVNWHHRRICQAINALYNGWTHRQLLATWGIIGHDLERQLSMPHPSTGLYAGMTHPDAIDARLRNLHIAVPPRCGKTTLASMAMPAWWFGKAPNSQIISASYSAALASKINRSVQREIDAEAYKTIFPGTRLNAKNIKNTDQNSYLRNSEMFEIVGRKGIYRSAGVSGGVTGMGADCVPGDCRISTNRGIVRMSNIVANPSAYRVWSYNHVCSKFELRRIKAVFCQQVSRLVQVTTSCGRVLKCTPDHLVWTQDHGYRPAKDLTAGQRLQSWRAQDSCQKEGHLLPVQNCHKHLRGVLSQLLRSDATRRRRVALRQMQETVQAAVIRVQKGPQKGQNCGLLLNSLHSAVQQRPQTQTVQDLRQTPRGRNSFLRVPMSRKVFSRQKTPAFTQEALHSMRQMVRGISQDTTVLWKRLCRYTSLQVDEHGVQPLVAQWVDCRRHAFLLPENIPRNKGAYLVAGQLHVRFVRAPCAWVKSACSPHRYGAWKQFQQQFDNTVRKLPYNRAQIQDAYVAAVQEFSCGEVEVYDIEVEKNHNFVAEGLQVHNCAIIDDPVKSRETADSAVIRETIWEWYASTLYTRLHKGAVKLLIMTRWHEDDLGGRILKQARADASSDQWFACVYPAILDQAPTPGDSRNIGDVLWPSHFPLQQIKITRATIGAYEFEALYQQRPAPREGGIIKTAWLQYYTRLPDNLKDYTLSADLTFGNSKAGNTGDFVAIQMWAAQGAHRFLVDQIHGRMEFTEQLRAIKTMCAKYPHCRVKLIEDAANGRALISLLRKEIQGLIAVPPSGSKSARLEAVSPQIEAGNVYLPSPDIAPWVQGLVHELASFPNAAHDDQVDAMSQGLWRMRNNASYLVGSAPGSITRASPWLG